MKKIVFLFVLLLFSVFCFSQQHKISVTAGNGGSIKVSINGNVVSPDPNKYDGSVPVNTNVSILAIPSSGYEFIKWSNGSATNPMDIVITGEKNLSAEFKKKDDDNKGDKYTITVKCGKNGNVVSDVDLIQKVDKDKVVNFTIKPNQGYELEAFKVGGKDVKSNINNNNYSHTVISDVTIDVSFKPTEQDKLTVEIGSVEHGKVTTKNDLKQLKKGDKIEFEIEPEDGYEIESFKLNDIEHKDDIKDGKFALAVDKNYSVSASFKQIGTENTVIIDIADSSKFYVRRFKDSVKIVDSVYLNLDFLKLPNDTVFLIKANDTILYSLFGDSLCIYIQDKSDSVSVSWDTIYFSDNVYAEVLDSLLHRLNVEREDTLTLFNSSQTLKLEASFSDLFVFEYSEDVPSEPLPILAWILIGVVVLAVVIFVVLWFFVLKRKKEKDSEPGADGKVPNGKTGGSNGTTDGTKSPSGDSNDTTGGAKSPSGGSNGTTDGTKSPSGDSNDTTGGAKSPSGGSNDTTGGAKSPSGDSVQPNPESDEISNLKKEIKKLKEDLNTQKQNEKDYKEKMDDYEKLKSNYSADIKKAKDDAKTEIKKDYENKIKELEKKKEEDKKNAQTKYDKLLDEKNKVEQKLNSVKDACESSFKKERQTLTEEKEKAEKQFKQKKQEFEAASAELTRTKNNLTEAKEKIQHLEVSQKRYADTISVIPSSLGAAGYATNIINLLNVYNSIQRKAVEMQDIKVEDKYPLYKANAIFEKNISVIDMSGFYADAEMVSRGELIFKNRSVISNAKNMSDVKFYFYTTYLEKFISALAIYNESLAGLYGWGYSKNDTSAFNDFRQKIESVAKSLGIKIEIPKLFDNADIGYDVYLVDGCEFDGQFSKGQILEIETCLVYLDGGNRPSARIKVKAQE
jgi:hypothetical protein